MLYYFQDFIFEKFFKSPSNWRVWDENTAGWGREIALVWFILWLTGAHVVPQARAFLVFLFSVTELFFSLSFYFLAAAIIKLLPTVNDGSVFCLNFKGFVSDG